MENFAVMDRIVECVPNFSEGKDPHIISGIADAIRGGGGKVLDIDSGADANRTVITFAGSPEDVAEAAFQAVRAAGELIDMRSQHGTHPRIGATDVLPLVPVKGISLEECATLARSLAQRVYSELGIPCYCYEACALRPERKRLEVCRAGEYESLSDKISDPLLRPDFGPDSFTPTVARCGASVIGARNFLIAVNFNLNSPDKDKAMDIARDVRESGRLFNGKRVPGTLKGVKAIGWYIPEYGFAQVSMNITDFHETPLLSAFKEVSRCASLRGLKVTGTEIIGLIPKEALPDNAVKELNLSQIRPFVPEKKILDYMI